MKNITAVFVFIISISMPAHAQKATPRLLKEPADWSFERFTLPPAFAPSFPYNGVEELRFSPGMFNKDSTGYFTYAFAAQLDGITTISQNDIRNCLLTYFKGLCSSTANSRKLAVDTSKITVSVEVKKGTPGAETIYNALLNVFGVFADGAPVKLNMEVKALINKATKKTYLIFIASPHPKTGKTWEKLYKIQEDFVIPV